jgi:hypothetical protein
MNCSETPLELCYSDFGYNNETDNYNSTYLGWVGRFTTDKYGPNITVDYFTGRVWDGVGAMTNTMAINA